MAKLVGRGFCGVTESLVGKDCLASDSKGAWEAADQGECIDLCRDCSNCHFISHDQREKDCSWYRHCPQLQSGRTLQHYSGQHVTYRVRDPKGALLPGRRSAFADTAEAWSERFQAGCASQSGGDATWYAPKGDAACRSRVDDGLRRLLATLEQGRRPIGLLGIGSSVTAGYAGCTHGVRGCGGRGNDGRS